MSDDDEVRALRDEIDRLKRERRPSGGRMKTVLGLGALIVGFFVVMGFLLPRDDATFTERARRECAERYADEQAANACAIALMARKLNEAERDRLDDAWRDSR